MPDDDPLRTLLHQKVSEASREAEAHEGQISAEQLEGLNRLARLVEVRDKTLAATPPRWRIAVALAATLLLVSLLIFLRVRETEAEMQLVVSEVGFVLERPQAITGIVNLAALEVSGLRGLQLSDPELSAWTAESEEEQKAARVAALESGTLTLDPLHLATGVDVRIDADRSPSGCRIVLRGARVPLRATAHGSVQVDLLGSGMRTAAFGIPRPLVFETDPGEVTLDLLFAKGSRAAFSPQLAIHKLALSRIDEFQAQEGTTVQTVSTILSGTLYLESVNGAARPLRPRELLRFDEIRGVIRTLELGDGHIALAFRGTVRGMRSGWGARPKAEMLKLLLEHGADVNVTDKELYFRTPLHEAAEGGQVEAAAYLISQKANVDAPGYEGRTPLFAAAEKGTNAVVELLLAHGANVNAAGGPGEGNRSALEEAARRKELAIVQTLVSAGAEIRYTLHHVLKQENAGAARILIGGGADLSLRNAEGEQPLHLAASEDVLTETVQLLLKAGAPVDAVDSKGSTPLHHAVRGGSPETIELLLAAKAPVNARTRTGRTALYQAVAQNRAPVVARLLKAGADPNLEADNSADKERADQNTAVARAAANGRGEILDMLLAAGGDPNRRGNAIASPLSMAAERRHGPVDPVDDPEKLMKSLLKAGARVIADGEPTTPFHVALGHDGDAAARMIALLLGAGGPVDAKDTKGRTPLHAAANSRDVVAVKVLLAAGANVHATDNCGETPLWTAMPGGNERGTLATAELLVTAGADVNARSTCQKGSLVELAEKHAQWKVRQLLLSKGAKKGHL